MPTSVTNSRPTYWRSLDQLENSPEFQEFLHREFPIAASEYPEGVSRRRWMQLMGASFALASVAGCRWQTEKIVPMAERPEGYIPGEAEYFATNINWADAPRHLLVTKYDGRPIKIEGNADHPGSRGTADAFTQAATLSLYDPDRASYPRLRSEGETTAKQWADVEAELGKLAGEWSGTQGAGLAVLLGNTNSYAEFDAIDALAKKYPAAKFYQYAPLGRTNELAGAELALGDKLRTHYKLAGAKVIASFDGDLLTLHPNAIAHARDFGASRDPDAGKMSRLWVVESTYTTTGTSADHRLPVKSAEIGALVAKLRDLVKSKAASAAAPKEVAMPSADEFIAVLAEDLLAAGKDGVVFVGERQPPEVHAIAHEINSLLGAVGNTVVYTAEPAPETALGSITELVAALNAGSVKSLVILGGNPGFDAPADLKFAEAVKKAPASIRLGCYDDETSRLCRWSLPQTHPLEEWGDAIAWDGTIGVCQPMIEPLLGGKSTLEVLAMLAGIATPDARQIVADAVAKRAGEMSSEAWNKLLHDGVLPESGLEPVAATLTGSDIQPPAASGGEGYELVFTPSAQLYDGRFANNGWLQELPDFLTKVVWDNPLLMSPETAKELAVEQGELVEVTVNGQSLELPVYLLPGQAKGSLAISVGYGRTAAGKVGGYIGEDGRSPKRELVNGLLGHWLHATADPVGFDTYKLRSSQAPYIATGVELKPKRHIYQLATTQDHHAIDQLGLEETGRRTGPLIREASLEHFGEHPDFAHHVVHEVETEPLWQLHQYKPGETAKWGMAIDLTKCIGCNACVIACQAENNVPVVGKDQVARNREMHWIRIDRYFKGDVARAEVAYQPIACQQCETAPCEQVCPVAATVHSSEGLNDMVYNRCVGTRYCANNCPYKVRRFNYFNYNKKLEAANNELIHLAMNPEVTIRARGVMEKCTYCVQRISKGRIHAKNEQRPLKDGEIVSACQQSCPTQAITFGDLNLEGSAVGKKHENPRAYGILTELMTKPRTLFLARIRNPHPKLAIAEPEHVEHGHDEHAHEEGEKHAVRKMKNLLPILS